MNRTSQAVDLLDDLADKQNDLQLRHPQASLSVSVPVDTAWAVAEKYRLIEKALVAAAESGLLGDSRAGILARDALAFDPLA